MNGGSFCRIFASLRAVGAELSSPVEDARIAACSAARSEPLEISRALHVGIHHALLAGLVERHGELVAVDRDDVAVAEFQVKHPLADVIGRYRGVRFRDELAFDRQRLAAKFLSAPPARRAGGGFARVLLGP